MSLPSSQNSSPLTPKLSKQEKVNSITEVIKGKPVPPSAEVSPGTGQAEAARVNEAASASKPESGPLTRPALELDDDEPGEPEKKSKKEGRSLDEFAQEYEIDPKEFYQLTVDLGLDGEAPLSIGALKDHYRESREFQKQRDDFEHEKYLRQTEIIGARTQLQAISDRISSVIGPENFDRMLGDVTEQHKQHLASERQKLLTYLPQWSDAQVMQRDRERMEQHLSSYGIDKYTVAMISDAVIMKYVMDSMNLLERYNRLKAGEKEKVATTAPASTKKHRPSTWDQAKALADKGQKHDAITLLMGQK